MFFKWLIKNFFYCSNCFANNTYFFKLYIKLWTDKPHYFNSLEDCYYFLLNINSFMLFQRLMAKALTLAFVCPLVVTAFSPFLLK